MSKIQRSNFTQQHQNKNIDLNKLDRKVNADPAVKADLDDAGVDMDKLRSADRNRDGKIDAGEAWKLADDYDRDGTRRSLIDVDRSGGEQTQAGKAAGALGALLANKDLQADKPGNDDILLVGMNETAKHEARNLRSNARGSVEAVLDSQAGNDQFKVGSTTYDLTTDEGRSGFVGTLGLPADQSAKIADAIGSGGKDAKDELAGIAQVWARGERGEDMPSRMVISGHHVGSSVWGDDNGRLTWTSLQKLSDAMPTAAGRVEDLHIAACYSGGASKAEKYQKIFPNAKTVWAYSGSAPGTWSGAMAHQKYWERATRGAGQDVQGTVDTLKGWGTRKAENIDARTMDGTGVYNGPPLAELRQGINDGEAVYQQYFSGERPVTDRQNGPLRGYYNQIQASLQHPDLPAAERQNLEGTRDQCIRRLFYESHIGHRFQETNASQIQAGYQALGLTPPDFASLSRADAQAKITEFQQKLAGTDNPPAEAQSLLPTLNGLWNLDSQFIPENWI